MILLIAGMETTAQTLTALTYHLLSNPPILRRLKQELELAMPDPNQLPIASKLDSLPYLVCYPHARSAITTERARS